MREAIKALIDQAPEDELEGILSLVGEAVTEALKPEHPHTGHKIDCGCYCCGLPSSFWHHTEKYNER